jgi:hypothetical protein
VVNAAQELRLGGIDPMRVVGLTVLAYVHHARTFLKLLRSRFELLPTLDFAYSASEREFMREVVLALDEEFSPEHLLLNADHLAAMLFGWLKEEHAFDPAESKRVEELVVHCCRQRMTLRTVDRLFDFELRNIDVPWSRPGQRTVHKTFTMFACSTIRAEHLEEARFMNELLSKIDSISDRDTLFTALDDAQRRIMAQISPLPPRGSAEEARHDAGREAPAPRA